MRTRLSFLALGAVILISMYIDTGSVSAEIKTIDYFYDTFDDGVIDTNLWGVSGPADENYGKIILYTDTRITALNKNLIGMWFSAIGHQNISPGDQVDISVGTSLPDGSEISAGILFDDNRIEPNLPERLRIENKSVVFCQWRDQYGVFEWADLQPAQWGVPYIFGLEYTQEGSILVWVNGQVMYSFSVPGADILYSQGGTSFWFNAWSVIGNNNVTAEIDWAKAVQVRCCDSRDPKKEPIRFTSRPSSPELPRRLTQIGAKSRERLEVWWAVPSPNAAHYELRYYRPGAGDRLEDGFRVGQCLFNHGCNDAWYYYSGSDRNNPDCFLSVHWTSIDFGADDPDPETGSPPDGLLDIMGFNYDVCSYKLSWVHSKHIYMCGPPLGGWFDFCEPSCKDFIGPRMWVRVWDPPLGPETEVMFDNLLSGLKQLGLSPSEIMMGRAPIRLCDMDWDRDCDAVDLQIVGDALGTCSDEIAYYPLADIDGDGCISESDIKLIYGVNRTDVNYDGSVDFHDYATLAEHWLYLSCEEANNWCEAGDVDRSGQVDAADMSLLAEHWLEGTTP